MDPLPRGIDGQRARPLASASTERTGSSCQSDNKESSSSLVTRPGSASGVLVSRRQPSVTLGAPPCRRPLRWSSASFSLDMCRSDACPTFCRRTRHPCAVVGDSSPAPGRRSSRSSRGAASIGRATCRSDSRRVPSLPLTRDRAPGHVRVRMTGKCHLAVFVSPRLLSTLCIHFDGIGLHDANLDGLLPTGRARVEMVLASPVLGARSRGARPVVPTSPNV